MNIDKKENEVLHKILIGELMASNIMSTYTKNLTDEELEAKLNEWIDEHNLNASKLSSYLLKNGGNADTDTGIAGYMANAQAVLNTWTKAEPIDILREVYDGVDKGLARSVDITKGELSKEGTELAEEIFSLDHDHLQEIKRLISEYEKSPRKQDL